MRRIVLRGWKTLSIRPLLTRRGNGKSKSRASRILPSNAQMVSVLLLCASTILFCFLGNDYLAPGTSIWDVKAAFEKRDALQSPDYHINKGLWTTSDRLGDIAFAMFPLVILFVLKTPPFAIFSIKWFTQLFSDKLGLLHRWLGRLIWIITTIHVVLWAVKLGRDPMGNGSPGSVLSYMPLISRFRWALVGYISMTLLVSTSLKWVRQKHFEVSGRSQSS